VQNRGFFDERELMKDRSSKISSLFSGDFVCEINCFFTALNLSFSKTISFEAVKYRLEKDQKQDWLDFTRYSVHFVHKE
jgi:hypothetical protein